MIMEQASDQTHSALQQELLEAFRSWKPAKLVEVAAKMLAAFSQTQPSSWALKDIQRAFRDAFVDKSLPNCTLILNATDIGSFTVAVLSRWDEAGKLAGFTLTFAPHHEVAQEQHQRWSELGFSTTPVFVPAREIHGRGAKKKAGGSSAGKKKAAKK